MATAELIGDIEEPKAPKEPETQAEHEAEIPAVPEDLFERLGIDENATDDEVKKAYRARMDEYYPRTHEDNSDPETYARREEWAYGLNEAKQRLNNEQGRKEYKEARERKRQEEARKKENERRQKEDARRAEEARREAERNATTEKIRDEVNAKAREKEKASGNEGAPRAEARRPRPGVPEGRPEAPWYPGRPYDPTHPNPFWQEQGMARSRFDPAIEGIQKIGRSISHGARAVWDRIPGFHPFRESVGGARRDLRQFETLLRRDQAEYMGESTMSYRDYQMIKKTNEQSGRLRLPFFLRTVGVYDDRGRFTGRVRTYRIYREPRHAEAPPSAPQRPPRPPRAPGRVRSFFSNIGRTYRGLFDLLSGGNRRERK